MYFSSFLVSIQFVYQLLLNFYFPVFLSITYFVTQRLFAHFQSISWYLNCLIVMVLIILANNLLLANIKILIFMYFISILVSIQFPYQLKIKVTKFLHSWFFKYYLFCHTEAIRTFLVDFMVFTDLFYITFVF